MPEAWYGGAASRRAATERHQATPWFERHQALKIADELIGARVQSIRNLDANGDVQVTRAVARQTRQPLSTEPEDLSARGATGHDDDGFALRGRHLDTGAADRLPHADRHLTMDVVTLSREERMFGNARADDQVASRPAEWPRTAFHGETELHPRINAGRDADGHFFREARDAAAAACVACEATREATACLARGARRVPRYVNRPGGAARGLGERDVHGRVDVITSAATADLGGRGHEPEPVVHRTGRWIAEDAVGLGDLLEKGTGAVIPEVDVRRILPRKAAIGLPNLARPRGGRDAEHRVVVTSHGHHLLLVAEILELGVHDLAFFRAAARTGACSTAARRRRLRLAFAVHDFGELVRRLGEVALGALHAFEIVGLERFLRFPERILDRLPVSFRELRAVLGKGPFRRVHERVGLVAHFDLLLPLALVCRVRLGLLDHAIDLVLRETRRRGDRDVLLLVRRLVLRRHVQDPVRVDVERDFDLRDAAWRGRDPDEMELAESPVVARHWPLSLHHMNLDRCLAVRCGRECLALLRRDRRVPRNERRHHAAQRFDTERQRSHVEEQEVLHLTRENRTLDRGADGHDLIRIDAL